jgi:hypothetical protein
MLFLMGVLPGFCEIITKVHMCICAYVRMCDVRCVYLYVCVCQSCVCVDSVHVCVVYVCVCVHFTIVQIAFLLITSLHP